VRAIYPPTLTGEPSCDPSAPGIPINYESRIGTGGSSSIPCGGTSLAGTAERLADNLKRLAAEALEAGAEDLEMADGAVRVTGTDRVISFSSLAQRPDAENRLTAAYACTPPQPTYPNGTHIAEVEIDPATGESRIVSYVLVDDFGATLNPLLLAGQVHGGTTQGIGQALMEHAVYDPACTIRSVLREPARQVLSGPARRS
jgi:carbon-monoxide dehydrogenase large subunit